MEAVETACGAGASCNFANRRKNIQNTNEDICLLSYKSFILSVFTYLSCVIIASIQGNPVLALAHLAKASSFLSHGI
jgi:hypothetical protein